MVWLDITEQESTYFYYAGIEGDKLVLDPRMAFGKELVIAAAIAVAAKNCDLFSCLRHDGIETAVYGYDTVESYLARRDEEIAKKLQAIKAAPKPLPENHIQAGLAARAPLNAAQQQMVEMLRLIMSGAKNAR
jgi:hypothetical protein